jgi:molecular chaperone DnaK
MERLIHPVIERCRGPVEQALHDAKITIQEIDKLIFVGGPTRMQVVREYFENFFQRKGEQGVDPMECVACGAAIQGGVLTGEMGDIVLVDVTPLTLGVETLGGVATSLVARNTPIPIKRSEIFTTAADMQTAVTIHVFQGERPFAADNTSLGEFNLEGIVPAPRGLPKIEVAFDIDSNGILDVTAKDMATNKTQSIRISGSTRLSANDKEKMVKEAERYAEQDKKHREEVEKLNNADSLCYQAEKMLADFGDKIPDDLKTRINAALYDTKDAVKKKDPARAAEKSEKLKVVLQEIGKKIYEQTPSQAQPQPNVAPPTGEARPTGSGSGGRVVDAEFKSDKQS